MSHAITAGSADPILLFRAYNTDGSAKVDLTASTPGIAMSVFRAGAAAVSISSLSNKAADNTTHSDGAIRPVQGNLYSVDAPDAACADQVPSIAVKGTYTGGVIEGFVHPIVGYSSSDAVRLGLSALPNAAADAAGGLPISDAGGLDMDAMGTKLDTLLARITSTLFTGITSLRSWLGAMSGKTADAGTLAEINATTAGSGYDNTTASLQSLRENQSSGGGSGTAGPGETPVTWTLEDGSGNPCRDTETWISTDDPFTTENTVGNQTTNDDGEVTYGIDEDVEYNGWARSDDFNFPRPVVKFRYDSTAEELQRWNGTAWEAWS